MRHVPRWAVFAVVLVLLVIGGLIPLAVGTARQSLPQTTGRITLPGLNGSVDVQRDAYGVPQIYADQPEDLFEAQGYVAAQDRFYEMDVRRHVAAGRLSELFGESQVASDTYVRTLGWRRVAEQELPLLSPSTRRYLDAYASGVNAYLRGRPTRDISLEYSLLNLQGFDYTPQEWTAVDSLSMLKVLAWQLGSNADQEEERARIAATVGSDLAADLYPGYPFDGNAPIVSRGTVVDRRFDPDSTRGLNRPLTGVPAADQGRAADALGVVSRARAAIPALFANGPDGEGIGSNSWVVSGAHTSSGAAMLSNDPHLATSIPSVFAQVGLHCRTLDKACPFDVAGFSITALPGVIIGRNNAIAWGLTTSYADVQDLYLEDVVGDTVRVGTAYVPLEVREEQLSVRGEDAPRTIRIRSTKHGPLLSDADGDLGRVGADPTNPDRAYGVALSWTASTPGRSMDALLGIDAAQDFTQFRTAAAYLSAPSQNLVYADVRGNIGYQLPGSIPTRGRGDGQTPSPGWDSRYDWTGTIPFAELPYVYNPPSGVIVAANQPVIGRQYPYPLGSANSYGWRSQQISDRLADAPSLTTDNAEDLFYDNRVRVAADLVPALLRIRVGDSWVAEGQQTLVGWDYSADADSAAAAYFNIVFRDLEKLTFRDQLPEDLWPQGGDRWFAVVAQLLQEPRNAWWDDVSTPDKVETRDDILLAAMTLARKEATSLMSRDTDQWQWGKLHRVRLRHQTLGSSGIAPLERIFNRRDDAVGGGPAVVDAMGFDDRYGYDVTHGPAMRMLVDLGSPDGGRWVNQSGASGHAYSPHYDDQAALWVDQRMWPFVFSKSAVDTLTVDRLVLEPEG